MPRIPHRLRTTRLEDRLAPAVATWDGGGTNTFWTNPINWVGDIAPQPGDDLVFGAGATRLSNDNDFPDGTTFGRLSVTAPLYNIAGNAVTLTGGTAVDFDGNQPAGLVLSVGGTGGLTKDGSGKLVITKANSYAGVTEIRNGVVGGLFGDGTLGATGAGNETVVRGAETTVSTLAVTTQGLDVAETITLHANAVLTTLGAGPATPVTFTQPITISNGEVSFGPTTLHAAGTMTLAGGVASSGGRVVIRSEPNGAVVLPAGATFAHAGLTQIAAGAQLVVDGTGPPGTVEVSGVLRGSGTVGTIVLTGNEGTARFGVAPAAAGTVGTLTANGFTSVRSGTFAPDLTDAGADVLRVAGTVTLASVLDLTVGADFFGPGTRRFRLVDNDGTDAVVGTFLGLPEGAVVQTVRNLAIRVSYRGGDGNDVDLFADQERPALAVAPGEGGGPVVRVYGGNGTNLANFLAYDERFRGGVRVAMSDITGDGVLDIVTAAGTGGGPHIKVFDGVSFRLVNEFLAYDARFTGGVWVAAGDINGDGRGDIVTGAGAGGGPHVRAFDGMTGAGLESFFPYDAAFTGGVTVTVVNGMIATGPGFGGGPDVRVFDRGRLLYRFDAFDRNFRGGVFLTGIDGGSPRAAASLAVAPGLGGVSVVEVYGFGGGQPVIETAFELFPRPFAGGTRLAAADLNGDGVDELVASPGVGGGPLFVQLRRNTDPTGFPFVSDGGQQAFDPAFLGGVYVG